MTCRMIYEVKCDAQLTQQLSQRKCINECEELEASQSVPMLEQFCKCDIPIVMCQWSMRRNWVESDNIGCVACLGEDPSW